MPNCKIGLFLGSRKKNLLPLKTNFLVYNPGNRVSKYVLLHYSVKLTSMQKLKFHPKKSTQFLTSKLRFFVFLMLFFATQISSHDLIATLAWELHFSFQRHLTLILIKSSSIYMGNVGNPLENTQWTSWWIFIRKMIWTKQDLFFSIYVTYTL